MTRSDIQGLAAGLGATIEYRADMRLENSVAWPDHIEIGLLPSIATMLPTTDATIDLASLHELGHIAHPELDNSFEGEAAAWLWAFKQLGQPSADQLEFANTCMGTYYRDMELMARCGWNPTPGPYLYKYCRRFGTDWMED